MSLNLSGVSGKVVSTFFRMVAPIFSSIGMLFLGAALLFFLVFFLRYRIKFNYEYLAGLKISFKPYDLLRWIIADKVKGASRSFSDYGFSLYVGRQGAGKSASMVEYLLKMREKYPKCLIVTNFECVVSDMIMTDWRDFMTVRNGEDGVIFAIDEIHSEWSSSSWKDFPEALLSQVSQQRKQSVKIVATAQRYWRVAKQIREQGVSIIECSTWFGRYTINREYDAEDYEACGSPSEVRKKVKPQWKRSFVQSDALRQSYDTYAIIERMAKTEFIPRHER